MLSQAFNINGYKLSEIKGYDAGCPDGYNRFGLYCYNKTCSPGYSYDGQMTCNMGTKTIGVSILPTTNSENPYCAEYNRVCCGGLLKIDCSKHCNGSCKTWRCSNYTRHETLGIITCSDTGCKSNRNSIDGLCYEKCPDGYKYNSDKLPTYCIPNDYKGAFYTQYDKMLPGICSSNAELVGAVCFTKCPSGYTRDSSNPFFCKK